MTEAIDHIGLLVTNDPTVGDGPLGLRRDVALVVDRGRVVAIEPAGVQVAPLDAMEQQLVAHRKRLP